jgi:hypothetical protein
MSRRVIFTRQNFGDETSSPERELPSLIEESPVRIRAVSPIRGSSNRAISPIRGSSNRAVSPIRGSSNRTISPIRARTNQAVSPARTNQAVSPARGRSPVRRFSSYEETKEYPSYENVRTSTETPFREEFPFNIHQPPAMEGSELVMQRKNILEEYERRRNKFGEDTEQEYEERDELEEDTDEEELTTSKSKISLIASLPLSIVQKISSLLESKDIANLITTTIFGRQLKRHLSLDLSDVPLTSKQLVKYLPALTQYNLIGLHIKLIKKEELNTINREILQKLLYLTLNRHEKSGRKIGEYDLSSLSVCTNLLRLEIGPDIRLPNIELLHNCTKLMELLLRDCHLMKTINCGMFEKLRILSVGRVELISLSDIGYCELLETITVHNTKIKEDIQNLNNMPSLLKLTFDNVMVENITFNTRHNLLRSFILINNTHKRNVIGLNNLISLETIYIENNNNLERVDLGGCKMLKTLTIRGRYSQHPKVGLIGDNPLRDCVSLEEIHLAFIKMENLTLLSPCSELKTVDIVFEPEASAVTLTGLEMCSKLTNLKLTNCNSLINITALAECHNLINLHIEDAKYLKFLEGLEGCQKLENVNLSRNGVVDLTPLSSCAQIKLLNLSRTEIYNIKPLSTCTNLQVLCLDETFVKNLTPLRNCQLLKELSLVSTKVKRLFPLRECINLKRLDVSYCHKLTSLKGLEYSINLENLQAGGSSISDISALSGCTSLSYLDLSGNKVKSVKGLSKCAKLVYLDISGMTIEDDWIVKSGLDELTRCPSLAHLVLDYSLNVIGKAFPLTFLWKMSK